MALSLRSASSADNDYARRARPFSVCLLIGFALVILLVRGEVIPKGRVRALVYRLGVFLPIALTYPLLRDLMRSLEPLLLDGQLRAIDEWIFGTSPPLLLEAFANPSVVEWFSFFYASYYFILGVVILPSLFWGRGQRLAELLLATLITLAVGHFTYTLVPAVGPWAADTSFGAPLQGGFFWQFVYSTATGPAAVRMDVFPSVHTGLSVTIALFAFGARSVLPYKYIWPIFAFFAANIVISTVLLRWHWAVDVLAGLALAIAARAAAVTIARSEEQRVGQEVWEPLLGGSSAAT
jgi:membrane-associated phospholipid phosphatase